MLRVGQVPATIRRPAVIAGLAGALAVALRVPFLDDPAYSDEGGLLVVSAHWHSGGPFLYGPLFVDRPPLLLGFFRLAGLTGGLMSLRVLGLALVLASVAAAYRAGARLGGSRGAAVAAVVCAALLADPRLGTREVDAETVGLPLVLLAAALALEGCRARSVSTSRWLLAGAGAVGSCALLAKQNLADGLVFALVLVATQAADHDSFPAVARRVGQLVGGAALPLVVAVAWSTTSTGPRGLWYAMYGFRLAGSSSLFSHTSGTQLDRLQALGDSAVRSGMLVVIVVSLGILVARRRDGVTVALVAMLVTELVGVGGGGYYWSHYLIAVIPATSLLLARCAGILRGPWLVGLLAGATMVSSIVVAYSGFAARGSTTSEVSALGSWLNQARSPGDSAVVMYGKASVFEATPLRPAYPFLWTLPQRVLDPHLTRLARLLSGSGRPTFLIVRMGLDPYGQDPDGRVTRAVRDGYRQVADVCGDLIYVRSDVSHGSWPPAPSCL